MAPNCSALASWPRHHHGGAHGLAGHARLLTQGAGRDLGVLRPHRVVDVGRLQAKGHQLGRVEPDAHGTLGAEQLGLAHTGNALQLGLDEAGGIVAQADRVVGRVAAGQRHEQQEVRAGLVDAHALLHHRRRQARRGTRQPVLHLDLGQIDVGAGLEGGGDGTAAVGLRHRLHVDHAGRAIELLLDDRQHAVFQHLGRRARVGGIDDDGRRRHRGVLRHRQLGDGRPAQHHDEQRDDPGEDRPVDEKTREHVRALRSAAGSQGRGRSRAGRRRIGRR